MLGNIAFALVIVASSVAAALSALLIFSIFGTVPKRKKTLAEAAPAPEETVFLFDDQDLVDASVPARALLDAAPMRGGDWARLQAFLAPRFERFDARIAALATTGRIEMGAADGSSLRLMAEHLGGLARITLFDPHAEGQGLLVDSLSQRAMEDEIASLRKSIDSAPLLVWRQDSAGAVNWANRAYLLQSGALDDDESLTWPLPSIFAVVPNVPAATPPRRMKIEAEGQKPLWFEVHSFPATDGSLHFALPADAAVHAEVALREFVQTLTKTFAHLPIGLAIFDRQRQLALFNPALIDLTTLNAEFLSARPTLFAVLDRMREARMIPEPKDYTVWRQQMNALEKAASNGLFEETWALPTGQTYRVTGRPHPEGAVAFLMEDITAEVAMTRRFRSELEMSQTVIDAMDEAIAVFSPAGVLILSNTAYTRVWGSDPGTTLGEITINDAMREWQNLSAPNPIWAEARVFVNEIIGRTAWRGTADLRDGRHIDCRFVPLSGGATLAGFCMAAKETAQPSKPKNTAKPVKAEPQPATS